MTYLKQKQGNSASLLAVCSAFVWSVSLPLLAEDQVEQPVQLLDLSHIPEEFRDLAGPQTTVADFYYGGRYVTSATVTYTPDTVTIADPASLIRRIQNVSRPEAVEAALTGEIFSNPGRACMREGDTGCGTLNPPVAGVIFDANRFRGRSFCGGILSSHGHRISKQVPAGIQQFSRFDSGLFCCGQWCHGVRQ